MKKILLLLTLLISLSSMSQNIVMESKMYYKTDNQGTKYEGTETNVSVTIVICEKLKRVLYINNDTGSEMCYTFTRNGKVDKETDSIIIFNREEYLYVNCFYSLKNNFFFYNRDFNNRVQHIDSYKIITDKQLEQSKYYKSLY